MIRSITVTNYLGESRTLELARPELTGLAVSNIDGLGPVKANVNINDYTLVDGGKYSFSRVGTRNITMSLIFLEGKVQGKYMTAEDLRQLTYRMFAVKKAIRIEINTDNKQVYTNGIVESNDSYIFSSMEGCSISILCPDPYMHVDSSYSLESVALGADVPEFEFPVCFSYDYESNAPSLYRHDGVEFSSSVSSVYSVIDYHGDAEIGVHFVINVLSAVNRITLSNSATSETMVIDAQFEIDDVIELITISGSKRLILIRNNVAYNIINWLSFDSNWIRLVPGENKIAYKSDGSIRIKLTYSSAFTGV